MTAYIDAELAELDSIGGQTDIDAPSSRSSAGARSSTSSSAPG